jgi:hypothetical protein
MKYSVLIVNYNLKDSITQLLTDLETQFSSQSPPSKYEVLIFDNASTDGSRQFFERLPKQYLRYFFSNRNLGFGAAMNRLAALAQGETLILLNPDLEIREQQILLPDWIDSCLTEDRVLLAPSLLNPNLSPQGNGGGNSGLLTFILQTVKAGSYLRSLGLVHFFSWLFSKPILRSTRYGKYFINFRPDSNETANEQDFDWVSGAFWVLRKQDFMSARGFDEKIFLYCEDEDLCRRLTIQTRRKIVKSTAFKAIHAVGGTQVGASRFSPARLHRLNSNIYFLRKWSGPIFSGCLRGFYFFYFIYQGRLRNSAQAILGLKISD